MSINRRQFLKRAGAMTALGLGGSLVSLGIEDKLVSAASEYEAAPNADKIKHWAMVVDMSKFKTQADITRVIQACDKIHNIPNLDHTKGEIKWIWDDDFEHTFAESENEYLDETMKNLPFIVMCNHCENPACVRACPTGATFKRADGIVTMDFHRCIGCRFCMGACPFSARSFNFCDPRPYIEDFNPDFPTRTKGVVEKCLGCYERLEKGEQPACAEASNGGMIFGDLNDENSEVHKIVSTKLTIRRRTELGTQPNIYYLVGGGDHV
ncbi:Fe-S-cluster-containing hydrogenase subunit [Desulfosporosinus acidiphilus SJ4]|uniref:Fe-S-cluster-containing hydrogenase subunit n=1 Tax=Desulfosporosinus acidiphilus (strain DSM 22704 / JCM 16185 / SJ4) TaxID=646529 RepID=I4D615_DESAJ|nr:4Fe-4S dicluster domain-containing protein [Desulfosporosinus acidiphilus]AFM41239.1 Fe-S-cluster-containing hydrogenase subunit [Desulfosporosinus acidiphilus SJ4]